MEDEVLAGGRRATGQAKWMDQRGARQPRLTQVDVTELFCGWAQSRSALMADSIKWCGAALSGRSRYA